MHTSLIVVALMAPAEVPDATATLKWQDSYGTARQMGKRESKPLAVFIGNGPSGWKKVAEEGALSEQAKQTLADGYVCLYVDRTRPGGRQLAESFEVSEGPGLVLSSRDGAGQAFFHAGSLSAGDLESRLAKYGSAEAITRTEVFADSRVSYAYDPAAPAAPAAGGYGAPRMQNFASPSFGGSAFGGGSANC